MSIKALEARAQTLAAAQAKQELPTSLPSPWQGAALVANQAADAFATKRADQATAAGREDLAKTMSQVGPEGPTPEQEGRITMRDPEIGKTYMAEIAAKRAAAAEVQARKEAAAEAAKTAEAAAVAQEGRVQARPVDEIAIVNKELAAGRMSAEEAAARKKKLLAGTPAEQKFETDMQEKSAAGQSLLGLLDEAGGLLNDPTGIHAGPLSGMKQGIGENMPGSVQSAIPGMLPDPKKTENTQRYNQIMGEQALEALTKMKGASSDRDVQVNFKIVNDPNATLLNKQKALEKLRAKIATLLQIHNDQITAAGGKVPTLAGGDAAGGGSRTPTEKNRGDKKYGGGADPLEGRTATGADGKKIVRRREMEPM